MEPLSTHRRSSAWQNDQLAHHRRLVDPAPKLEHARLVSSEVYGGEFATLDGKARKTTRASSDRTHPR